jgi:hypothetical protein
MLKKSPQVVFTFEKRDEGDWRIFAHYPGAKVRCIKGFKSQADVYEWLLGTRRLAWLRSKKYGK